MSDDLFEFLAGVLIAYVYFKLILRIATGLFLPDKNSIRLPQPKIGYTIESHSREASAGSNGSRRRTGVKITKCNPRMSNDLNRD